MEKRFGPKDFFLFAGLLLVLLSVWLLMFQVDRQWEFIAKVEKQIEEQSKDLSELRRQIRSGRPLNGLNENRGQEANGAWQGFSRLAEIMISKQRHGPTGNVKVEFEAMYTKFKNLENK